MTDYVSGVFSYLILQLSLKIQVVSDKVKKNYEMIERSYMSRFCHRMYGRKASGKKLNGSFTMFPGRWIGRGDPIAWPPRSSYLSCLDFFLWSYMKSLIYECPIESDMDLVAKIAIIAGDIREMPGDFANVRQSLSRRCEACISTGERYFAQFFWVCTSITFLLIKRFLLKWFLIFSHSCVLMATVKNYLLTSHRLRCNYTFYDKIWSYSCFLSPCKILAPF